MKRAITYLIILLLFISCESTEPEEKKPPVKTESGLSVNVERFSCTYAWIDFSVPEGGRNLNLSLTDFSIEADTFMVNDSTIYIEGLLPGKTYTLTAECPETEIYKQETITYNFRTLDTTSHDFTYEVFELGEGISNILRGVDIIDENNIWAVGEVYGLDSSDGVTFTRHNLVTWDGLSWKKKNVTADFRNGTISPGLHDITAISHNQIFIASGLPIIGEGNDWILYALHETQIYPEVNVIKCAVENENEVYFAGPCDKIVKYHHGTWQLFDKPTDLYINEVYVNNGDVYATGASTSSNTGILLLKKKNDNQFKILKEGRNISDEGNFEYLYSRISSVWVDENNTLYTGSTLIYQFKNNKWSYIDNLPGNYFNNYNLISYRGAIYEIEGNNSNDIFLAGDRGSLLHYNGNTWKQIGEPYDPGSGIILVGLSVKGNTVCAVGIRGSTAYVIILKR